MRSLALLVNPHAAGGRPLRLLPRVEARLRELGLPFSVQRTQSLLHGCELAREAAGRGEVPVTLSGDGLIGAVAGALRDVPDAVLGVLPGGRGNDFARMIGMPLDAVAACDVLADGAAGADRPRRRGRAHVPRHRLARLRLGGEPDRERGAARARPAGLRLRGARARSPRGRPRGSRSTVDGERAEFAGWSVAAANSGFYGGGMRVAPHARLDDGALDVVSLGECSPAALRAHAAARSSAARTSTRRCVSELPRRRGHA